MKEVCSFYLTWVIKIIENLLWRLSTLKARAIWGALIASSYWSSMTTNEFFSIVEKNFVEGSPSEINKPNINYIQLQLIYSFLIYFTSIMYGYVRYFCVPHHFFYLPAYASIVINVFNFFRKVLIFDQL